MAPNLVSSKHELIYDMIHSDELSITEGDGTRRWLQQEHHFKNLFQYKSVWQRQSTAN
jgi:hypothetical protein